MNRLAIIVPCLNEEEILPHTIGVLSNLLTDMVAGGEVSPGSFLLLVDDGSCDSTWQLISAHASPTVKGVSLSHRCGQQIALLAGLEEALPEAEMFITIDADLQDDVSVIPEMVKAHEDGADIVYGVRRDRNKDSWMKKNTASMFYSTMRHLGVDCVSNHADFRLMSSRAVTDLLDYRERNLYLRGLVPMLGYRQACVFYDRKPRLAGQSKYPVRKMFDFAIDGITSFSVRPVRMLFWLGIIFTLTAFGIGIYSLIRHFTGETIAGWTSLMLSIWFCTGVLLMGLGIIGEYIGKIYIEVKKRPRYKVAGRV
ncbi:MAG: glycosyltransferase family 2 protein [Muribaculaceae bacterium]|nr:glycosyltransferase family 2 protein [Muribaculaceae bacterium]